MTLLLWSWSLLVAFVVVVVVVVVLVVDGVVVVVVVVVLVAFVVVISLSFVCVRGCASWTWTLRRPAILHRHLPCHAMPPCHTS